jgi:hypothetical protein
MALPITGLTGPVSVGNNTAQPPRLSKFGETVTHEQNGQFFENTLNGQTFIYSIASQALILTNTTGNSLTVWNPSGSGKIFVPISLTITYISGTLVVGGVVIATTLNAGANIGTGAPIPTATLVAAKSALRGGNVGQSVMNFAPTTITFTAAPVVEYATQINYNTTAGWLPQATEFFNGKLAYYPGSAMTVCYTVTTSTALFAQTVVGIEIPIPPGS